MRQRGFEARLRIVKRGERNRVTFRHGKGDPRGRESRGKGKKKKKQRALEVTTKSS